MRDRIPHVILSAIAFGGGGKSHLATTMPTPVHAIALDPNTKYVIDQAIKDGTLDERDVELHEFKAPPMAWINEQRAMDEAYVTWNKVLDRLEPLVRDPRDSDIGSVVIDKANQLYDLGVIAEIGKLDQIHPEVRKNKYGVINRRYSNIITGLHQAGHNVLLLHDAKEKWVSTQVRGPRGMGEERNKLEGPFDMERAGYKNTSALVSIEVALAFDQDKPELELADRFGLKWFKNTHRPALTGKRAWGEKEIKGQAIPVCSFAYLMAKSFPSLDVRDLR